MLETVAVILLVSVGVGVIMRMAPASKRISTWKIVLMSLVFFTIWSGIILPTLK
jgi:hypothetical protein